LAAFITDLGAAWSTRTDKAPETRLAGATVGQDRNESPPPAPRPAPPLPQPAREIATAHVGKHRSTATTLSITRAGNHAGLTLGSSAAAGRFNGDEEVRAIFDRVGDRTAPAPSESSDQRMPMPLTVSLTASDRAALSSGSRAAASAPLSKGLQVQADLDRPAEERHVVPIASSDDAYSLARWLLRSGDRNGAEQAFKLSLERTSSPAAAYELGHLLQEQGRYIEAASSYQLAVQLAPERAYMLYDLGAALAKLERLDEAATMFERAAELDPTNPYIFYDWGWALERAGAIALAENKYRAAFAAGADTAAGKNARARLRDIGRYRISSR
jgi:Flp pilus assembly protein TadD